MSKIAIVTEDKIDGKHIVYAATNTMFVHIASHETDYQNAEPPVVLDDDITASKANIVAREMCGQYKGVKFKAITYLSGEMILIGKHCS